VEAEHNKYFVHASDVGIYLFSDDVCVFFFFHYIMSASERVETKSDQGIFATNIYMCDERVCNICCCFGYRSGKVIRMSRQN
jgi:hypothetical protein